MFYIILNTFFAQSQNRQEKWLREKKDIKSTLNNFFFAIQRMKFLKGFFIWSESYLFTIKLFKVTIVLELVKAHSLMFRVIIFHYAGAEGSNNEITAWDIKISKSHWPRQTKFFFVNAKTTVLSQVNWYANRDKHECKKVFIELTGNIFLYKYNIKIEFENVFMRLCS